jgi:hypothetical protein
MTSLRDEIIETEATARPDRRKASVVNSPISTATELEIESVVVEDIKRLTSLKDMTFVEARVRRHTMGPES